MTNVLAAAAFVFVLNLSTFLAMAQHSLSPVHMGESVDEFYYFSLIGDVAAGYEGLGHATLKEHRFDPSTASYAPLLQGLAMRFFDLTMQTTVILGDMVFPFLIALLLIFACSSLFHSRAWGIATGLLVLSVTHSSLLRSISPQVTLILFVSYLACVVLPRQRRIHFLVRGTLIGLTVLAYPVMVPPLLAYEFLDLLRRLRADRSARSHLPALLSLAAPFICAVIIKLMLGADADSAVMTDSYHRLGLIRSHLPAAPLLQVMLLVTAAALCYARRGALQSASFDHILLFVFALLLSLNQSVLHGIDIIFGLYYRQPALIIMLIGWMLVAWRFLSARWTRPASGFVLFVAVFLLIRGSIERIDATQAATSATDPAIATTLSWLRSQPGERVVLAPYEIANRVPVFTQHYVFFNQFARYQYASDRELAERFLVQETFFPTPEHLQDDTYNVVFGLYAGNQAARQRSWCRVLSLFQKSDAECRVPIRDVILHQDVLRMLDDGATTLTDAFSRYEVDIVVTDRALPEEIAEACNALHTIGSFSIWDCSTLSGSQ